jgi:CRP-like cAMP-binding protein
MAKRNCQQRIEKLQGLAAFHGCSRKELEYVDGLGSSVQVADGAVLTRQGNRGRQCAVIEQGSVVVVRDHQVIGVAGPGEWVGELSLLDHVPCTATTVALGEARVLVFTPSEFEAIRSEVPAVDANICRQAGERRATLERVAEEPAAAGAVSIRLAAV